jgi:hypothetical protein
MTIHGTAQRITWLLPEGREAYRVHRGALPVDDLPAPGGSPIHMDLDCLRCGALVGEHGTGYRRPYTALVRERGTSCAKATAHRIHGGCIPKVGQTVMRGLPARASRSSL